jgi:hypothetical protein
VLFEVQDGTLSGPVILPAWTTIHYIGKANTGTACKDANDGTFK